MSVADATILLVDDHSVVREGYRSVLQKQPGLRVIAEAADGAEAYRLYKSEAPDLVIMDLSMPGIGGIEAVRRIRQWDKAARILVFTMHQNAGFAVQAIRAGGGGALARSSSASWTLTGSSRAAAPPCSAALAASASAPRACLHRAAVPTAAVSGYMRYIWKSLLSPFLKVVRGIFT